MHEILKPWQLLFAILSGWVHRRQQVELDDFRLPLVDPAAKHHKQELPGLQNEVHESPDAD